MLRTISLILVELQLLCTLTPDEIRWFVVCQLPEQYSQDLSWQFRVGDYMDLQTYSYNSLITVGTASDISSYTTYVNPSGTV